MLFFVLFVVVVFVCVVLLFFFVVFFCFFWGGIRGDGVINENKTTPTFGHSPKTTVAALHVENFGF